MDEEFIIQVTEEELAQFPEEGNQSEEEQNQQEYKQGLEIEDKAIEESTEKQYIENNKVKIPSLLDLKLPKLYAASRNGSDKYIHISQLTLDTNEHCHLVANSDPKGFVTRLPRMTPVRKQHEQIPCYVSTYVTDNLCPFMIGDFCMISWKLPEMWCGFLTARSSS